VEVTEALTIVPKTMSLIGRGGATLPACHGGLLETTAFAGVVSSDESLMRYQPTTSESEEYD
jgi:hypothetical protein